MSKTGSVEILFVAGSSRDRKGKRILIREGIIENYLWPGDEIADVDMKLLGLTARDKCHIAIFFGRSKGGT